MIATNSTIIMGIVAKGIRAPRRMEEQDARTLDLLKAVNDLLKAVNERTLARMEQEILAIKAKTDRLP